MFARQHSARRTMAKPVIGIIGNAHTINDEYPVQAVGVSNIEAVADLTGAIPLVVPALPMVGAISDLIEACGGAIEWLACALAHAEPLGQGSGPVDHLWETRTRGAFR